MARQTYIVVDFDRERHGARGRFRASEAVEASSVHAAIAVRWGLG